jgi:ParB-like chromosome segregation protein Spo0J
MSEIREVKIGNIVPNAHRDMATYPLVEKKIESLMRSINDPDVGFWEGIIARPAGTRVELAFGHHRLEAARRCGLTKLPVIIKDLTDQQMLQYMGRENGEDYSTDFLIMLNTWEGAMNFRRHDAGNSQPIDIAQLLGWTRLADGGGVRMNETAQACAAAHALIVGGYMVRSDLEGLSVRAAKEIVTRAQSRMEQISKMAAQTQRPAKEVEHAKQMVAKGAKATAGQVQRGEIAQKDLRAKVDVNTYKAAAETKAKPSPLFAVFGASVANSIDGMLKSDGAAQRLEEIVKVVNSVTMSEDFDVLRKIDFYLGEVSIRAQGWQKRLIPSEKKITPLKSIKGA